MIIKEYEISILLYIEEMQYKCNTKQRGIKKGKTIEITEN